VGGYRIRAMTAEELLMLVREGRDSLESFYALEGARDEVRREHLPALAAAYPIAAAASSTAKESAK
jgi:hypothetical protein